MTKDKQKQKILEFIERGEQISKEEYRSGSGAFAIPHISGPLFETWMNEISIFNDRFLNDHPLHSDISKTVFHHKTQIGSHKYMMGHLKALESDSEFWQDKDEFQEISSQAKQISQKGVDENMTPIIFISHRTEDAEFAGMLKDFFVSTNIPNDYIFCSSLPGNNVHHNIAREVKEKIANSTVNIAILSKSYYESPYCVNEAGIIWLQDPETPSVLIGLPEIDHTKMLGFLDGNYILRRLDNPSNIAEIYDIIQKAVNIPSASHTTITNESQKLIDKYTKAIVKKNGETKVSNKQNDSLEKSVPSQQLPPLEKIKKLLQKPEDWVDEDSKYYHNMYPQYTIVLEDEKDDDGCMKEGHRMFYHHLQTDTNAYYGTIKIFCNGTQLFSCQSTDIDGHRMTAPCPESKYISRHNYDYPKIYFKYYIFDSLRYLLLRFFEFHIGKANGQEAQIATRNLLGVVLLFDTELDIQSFCTYVNTHMDNFDRLVSQQKKYPIFNETKKAAEIIAMEISHSQALVKMQKEWKKTNQ